MGRTRVVSHTHWEDMMRIASLAAVGAVGFTMLLTQGAAATAAEVNVMAGNALAGVIGELGPQFERATGHKLVMQYGLSRTFKPKIEAGEAIDLIILSLETIDDLAKQGKVAAGTRADIARTGVGVAVRADASKPDINSIDAFKRSLLNAKSISWAPRTETGEHLAKVFERLGITEEIRARTKLQQAVDRVAKLVGKIPAELQTYLTFTAGVGVAATQPEAAKALIKHLTSPEAAAVITARGWEPVTR